jgi:ribosome hibernation promoting factor
MSTEITGRNYEVSAEDRALLDKKLVKIEEKLFDDVIDVRVVLQVEKYRNICEILIIGKEHDVKAVQESEESMQDAINAAVDHVKRQAQKNRKKIREHHRDTPKNGDAVTDWTIQVLDPEQLREPSDSSLPRIIQRNNIPIRPMTIEDAAMRLEHSKNEFVVFRDLDTDKISVLYKRRDSKLGLIAPEV